MHASAGVGEASHAALNSVHVLGAESHAFGTAVMQTAAAGAAEISPIIQMIMRMPGQIGLMSSFFEALGNWLLPHLHAIGLDPSLLDLHAHVASALHGVGIPGVEHAGIDPSLLPSDAPIFANGHGLNIAGALHRDVYMMHSEALSPSSSLNVSAEVDLSHAGFEGAGAPNSGELLSGPSVSDAPVANHLAGTQRMFADHFNGTFGKPGMRSMFANAGSTPSGLSSTVPLGTSNALSNSLNASSTTYGAQPSAMPAVAQMKDGFAGASNAGFQAGNGGIDMSPAASSTNSMADMSGSRNLLAANNAESFKPYSGGSGVVGNDYGANYIQGQHADTSSLGSTGHSASDAGAAVKGLKAKELSLDGIKSSAAPSHKPVMDHIAHQSKAGAHADSSGSVKAHSTAQHGHSSNNLAKRSISAPKHAQPQAAESDVAADSPADGAKIASSDAVKDAAQQANDATKLNDATPKTYTIRAGDCLWNIAKNNLGSGMKWQEIYKMNQDVLGSNPDLVYSGTTIKLPGIGNEIAQAGTDASKYLVRSGDCLWDIAKNQMGDATKWSEIYKANADVIGSNPSLILPGQHLSIPGQDGAALAHSGVGSGEQLAQASAPGASPELGAAGSPVEASAAAPQSAAVPEASLEAGAQQGAIQPAAMQTYTPAAPVATPATTTTTTPSLNLGPGAAGAAELHTMPLNAASEFAPHSSGAAPVSSSIGADLASFLNKRK